MEVTQLTTLESLVLVDNQFEGFIPSEIGNLTNLKELAITQNNFRGLLPREMNNLTNLKTVMLSDNDFDMDYVSVERTEVGTPIINFDLTDKFSDVATDDANMKD